MADTTNTSTYTLSPECPTFTLFPKLRSELRDKIWKFAGQEQRVVKFQHESEVPILLARSADFPGSFLDLHLSKDLLAISHTTPGIIHANKEARRAALKGYEIITFLCHSSPRVFSMSNPLYFNFTNDLLYLDEAWLLEHLLFGMECLRVGGIKNITSQIRHLMVGGNWRGFDNADYLGAFPNLETMILERQVDRGTANLTKMERLSREEEQDATTAKKVREKLGNGVNTINLKIKFLGMVEMWKLGHGVQITTTILC